MQITPVSGLLLNENHSVKVENSPPKLPASGREVDSSADPGEILTPGNLNPVQRLAQYPLSFVRVADSFGPAASAPCQVFPFCPSH